ncbi:MAG TPA: hypothetical protein VFN97_12370 [Actinospica sp.]|nr:hypothetical protein [Actinospica sp.]
MSELFEPMDASEAERFAPLERAYAALLAEEGVTARAGRFEPAELPAALGEEGGRPTLRLNAANPLVRRLAARSDLADEVGRSALRALYNNSVILWTGALPADSARTIHAQFNQVIDLLLELAEKSAPAPGGRRPQPAYSSCAVTLPEGEPRSEEIFAALRAVLESRPYYWQVVRADAPAADSELPPDLDEPPARAALNVTVFAGPKLNQGLINEVSIGQILGLPQLILCDEGHPELPLSFEGVPRQTVRGLGAVLREVVLDGLNDHPEVCPVRAHERYLSASVLACCAGLDEGAGSAISARYPTWPEFLSADAADVARATGVDVALVRAAKSGLRLLAEEE